MKIPFVGSSPVRKNLLANLFGVGVQLTNQVLLVPFFIIFWGNELYSDWIVLSALTAIFSMSDVGLNNVIQNRFAIKFSEGDIKECNSLITNNYILILTTLVLTLVGVLVFEYFWDITGVMAIHKLTRTESNWVFALLLVKVFVGMLSSVADAVYRGTHNASLATYITQVGLLSTSILTLIGIILKCNIVLLCILITLPQLIITIIKYFHSKRYFSYKFTFKTADFGLFKQILLPSFTFMAFPLGNTIVLQGYTLVVNTFFGADAVVLYNTTRTLCNFCKTALATLQSAVWPEYSIAYGNKDYNKMRHLHRKILKTTAIASAAIAAGLLLLGPFVYKVWTQGAVVFSYSLMAAYVCALIIESLWTSSAVTLMATNNHSKLGFVYIVASSISLSLALVAANLSMSLWVIAATLIIMHTLIVTYAIPAGLNITKDCMLSIKAEIKL